MLEAIRAKFEEIYKALINRKEKIYEVRKAEEIVKARPLAYLLDAFIGGLLIGYLASRKPKKPIFPLLFHKILAYYHAIFKFEPHFIAL